MKVIQIVDGKNLRELIKNALEKSEYNRTNSEIMDYQLTNSHKKTIVKGLVNVSYWNYGKNKYSESIEVFEINVGSHKNGLLVFDEFEVIIG